MGGKGGRHPRVKALTEIHPFIQVPTLEMTPAASSAPIQLGSTWQHSKIEQTQPRLDAWGIDYVREPGDPIKRELAKSPPPPPGPHWTRYFDEGNEWFFYDGPHGKWWCKSGGEIAPY